MAEAYAAVDQSTTPTTLVVPSPIGDPLTDLQAVISGGKFADGIEVKDAAGIVSINDL